MYFKKSKNSYFLDLLDLWKRISYKLKKNIFTELLILKRRRYLAKKMYLEFQGEIKYGLFKGVKYEWWRGINCAKLLGINEKEVLDEIKLISKKLSNPYFIDIGSSDGYYPVGFLKKNIFKYCFSFESGEKERKLIEKNASSNNVIDRISNNGYFHGLLSQKIERKILENSVILMDIAGGEFQIITEEFLQDIKNSFLIIELHDHYFKDGEEKLNTLKNRINKFFVQKEIKTSQRDLSIFRELSDIPDSDRWLMCSEGRRVQGHWLVLYPKRNF